MNKLSAKLEANAFKIWRVAAPVKWRLSTEDICRDTGLTFAQVKYVLAAKGWGGRLQATFGERMAEAKAEAVQDAFDVCSGKAQVRMEAWQ